MAIYKFHEYKLPQYSFLKYHNLVQEINGNLIFWISKMEIVLTAQCSAP